MSDDATAPKVTPSQALLVFSLVARHGEAAQAEMRPEVKKPNRDALVAAKLIGVRKVGRGLQITLEDAGWAWAGAHLGTVELPPVNRAMQDLLARLGAYLKRSDETLAGFIGSKPTAGCRARRTAPPPHSSPATARRRGRRDRRECARSPRPPLLRR